MQQTQVPTQSKHVFVNSALNLISRTPHAIAVLCNWSVSLGEKVVEYLVVKEVVEKEGASRSTVYVINTERK